MSWLLILALAAPALWALTNVVDKTILSHRVRNVYSFAVLAAILNLLFGTVFAFFLDWSAVSASDLILPIVAGVIMGVQFYFYYLLMSEEDPSHVIGLIYTYPIVVSLLSYLFLDEVVGIVGYAGMALAISGALFLSGSFRKLRVGVLLGVILMTGLYEFLVKASTISLPAWNGVAINNIVIGLVMFPLLLSKGIREGFPGELRNAGWAVFSEILTFLCVAVTFVTMEGLPATIVASVGATQPLFVLILERIAHLRYGGIVADERWLHKLVPILLIVLGVALLYVAA